MPSTEKRKNVNSQSSKDRDNNTSAMKVVNGESPTLPKHGSSKTNLNHTEPETLSSECIHLQIGEQFFSATMSDTPSLVLQWTTSVNYSSMCL